MLPRLGIRSINTAAHAHPTSTFAKPHAARIPTAASLSTTTVLHAPPAPTSSVAREPTPPQLPPRRRPQFAAAGFGLGGSHDVGKGKRGTKGKTMNVPVAAVPMEGEDQVDGLQDGKAESNEAEACYVPPPATLHYHHPNPLPLTYSPHPLPYYSIAYETWGKLNADASNAILLHTGLSASSHVASGGNGVAQETGGKKGWWEDFVGPGKSVDTDKFFVICTNVVGGCFGSTGPSSQWPHGEEGERWATRFPMVGLFDMVRAQLDLLDSLGIHRLYASIGSSMGGMQSLALAYLEPERVGRVASISATGRSGLNGVGMRFAQRSVLMSDPNWNRGFYYDGVPPHAGMKLARQIATITYRSGPEWETRFGRKMLSESTDESGKKTIGVPSLSPDFLIETYLDHQGERFCLTYDANSMIYLSKAMDLFDMTEDALVGLADKFREAYPDEERPFPYPSDGVTQEAVKMSNKKHASTFIPTSKSPHLETLSRGLARLRNIPALVLGVQSDVLFPVEQQRELSDALKLAGNQQVTYYELGGVWGHDTFLLDVQGVGGAIRGFLH
ncbi:hypothetical protein NliqN6_0268 [Naganishia liquefaciens]|uniref:AB hydrolase-1 domain-containing protein n=1 Tax=Naganishia liquefaciens TaxID=104408 RepID=A0A8H3TMK1_9TREE|nr:hypothetical protein NliqN6_0268 [Naganishia liquefaciens]